MPLLFIILVIVVVCICGVEGSRNELRKRAIDPGRRSWFDLTNAAKEREIMDSYVKKGYSFDDAYVKTKTDITALGFTPCIPREAYSLAYQDKKCDTRGWMAGHRKPSDCTTDISFKEFDSERVAAWYSNAEAFFKDSGYPGGVPYDVFQEKVYNRKKKSWEFEVYRPIPIGRYVTHPLLGECEVLDYYFYGDPVSSGRYKLRIVQTGEITTDIVIGDRDLQRKC